MAVLGLALLLRSSDAGRLPADRPFEATLFAWRCQTFTRFKVWVSWRAQTLTGSRERRYVFRLQDDGQFDLDRVRGKRRYHFDGTRLTESRRSWEEIRVVEGYDDMIRDLWIECRSGFPNATWTESIPPDVRRVGDSVHWYRVELPYDWARSYAVYIEYIGWRREPHKLRLVQDGAVVRSFTLQDANWQAAFPPGSMRSAYNRNGPEEPPPTGYDKRRAHERREGTPEEDLLIPIGPPK